MPVTHLDDERIERMAHAELEPSDDAGAHEHFASCAICQARVEAARREDEDVSVLLRTLDHAPPALEAATVAATARRAVGPRVAGQTGVWLRRAALVALTAGIAGAAWALPGSPVRALVDRMIGRNDAPAPAPQTTTPAGGGIAIAPGNALTILFTRADTSARLFISLIDGREVEVEALGAGAAFTDDPDAGRLVVENAASTASFAIRIPRAAAHVEVRVADRAVFLKDGRRLVTSAVPDEKGVWTIALAEPPG